jgi:hypothetical protein
MYLNLYFILNGGGNGSGLSPDPRSHGYMCDHMVYGQYYYMRVDFVIIKPKFITTIYCMSAGL